MVHPSAKRRKLAAKVEEINFDTDARQEYLTGFRKRKLQRQRHAQEVAERKAKEIKRDERRKVRRLFPPKKRKKECDLTGECYIAFRFASNERKNTSVRLKSIDGN